MRSGGLRSFGPAQTTSSAGQPLHVNSSGDGDELARVDAADRRRQLRLEPGQLVPLERGRDDCVGALEEVVDDLDLVGPGTEARERVHEPLQRGSRSRRSLRASLRRASSSCSRRRARAAPSRYSTSRRPCSSTPSCSNANGRSGTRAGQLRDPRRELRRRSTHRRTPRSARAPRRSRPGTSRERADTSGGAGADRSTSSSRRCAASPISVARSPPSPPGSVPRSSRRPATRSA